MARDRTPDDAQDLFDRGHRALAAGEFHEAVECFSRAVRLRPDVAAGYRYRAYALLELGDRTRALNDLDHAVRLKPDDPQALADRAAELYAQKAFDQAVADCDRVLELDPGRAAVYGLRGRCHADRGDTAAALRDFAAAVAGDPDHAADYLLSRARLHLDCDDYAACVADCTAAIRLDPDNPWAHHTRGTALHELSVKGPGNRGHHPRDPSADEAGAAEAMPPAEAAAMAEADFGESARLDPDNGWPLLGRALVRLGRGDLGGAEADATRVIALMPEVSRGYELRGTARRQAGDLGGALADFDRAVELAPQSAAVFNQRAGVHYARGDFAAAVRDHMAALKRDPRHAGTFNQLGWIWATAPDPDVRNGDRARECATRACELTEWQEAGFLDTLAAACAECGEFEEAVKWQEKARAIAPPSADADYRARLEIYRARKPYRTGA